MIQETTTRLAPFHLIQNSRKVHSTHLDSRLSNCMWQGFWFGFGSKKTKCQGTKSRTHHGVSPEGVATTGPFCWFLRPQQAMSICFSNWIFGVTRWLWTVKNWMYPPRSLRYRLKSYLISSLLYLPNRNGSRGVSMIFYVFFFLMEWHVHAKVADISFLRKVDLPTVNSSVQKENFPSLS